MATKKKASVKKRRSGARQPALREVDAIDCKTLSALAYFPRTSPDGDGQMPILAAVHWIASEGLKLDHDLFSIAGKSHYCNSAKAFFRKVALEKVRVRGENLDEDPEQIASAIFDDDLVPVFDFAEDPPRYVRHLEFNVSDGEQSMDTIFKAKNRGSWTNVKVFCEDVRRVWPYQGLPRCDDNSPEEFCDAVPSEIQKGPKAEITRQALRSKFRDGLVPKHLSSTEICERIKPEMLKLGDNGGADRSTVERLLKRRK
jgi:hypothetical protein